MIKLGNKGFFLAETIVITGIVAAFLAFFYSQISNLYRNYERNSRYNTVSAMHANYAINNYLNKTGFDDLKADFEASGSPIYDFTDYTFDSTGYFNRLITDLNVDKVYFTQYNINDVVINYATYQINAEFLDFLKTQRVSNNRANIYRIILILENGYYSSILVDLS